MITGFWTIVLLYYMATYAQAYSENTKRYGNRNNLKSKCPRVQFRMYYPQSITLPKEQVYRMNKKGGEPCYRDRVIGVLLCLLLSGLRRQICCFLRPLPFLAVLHDVYVPVLNKHILQLLASCVTLPPQLQINSKLNTDNWSTVEHNTDRQSDSIAQQTDAQTHIDMHLIFILISRIARNMLNPYSQMR